LVNVIGTIKRLARHTPFYGIIRRRRACRLAQGWDESDEKRLAFYSRFIEPGAICFDVGANVGNRTKVFLRLGATVVAVEPQVECARVLKQAFGENSQFRLVEKALGERVGEAEMMISNADTVSSMSTEWIRAVKASGRFADTAWDRKRIVPVTTLDELIREYGSPAFMKIDVEGYEYSVVKGLSQAVSVLSVEFTPEMIESTISCIEHLSTLGSIHLNYSLGESMQLCLDQWIEPDQMREILAGWRDDHILFGDVYLRFDEVTTS
jgi:FkbM family methyltransferase